jgi:small-conductance mechanosensitive channel
MFSVNDLNIKGLIALLLAILLSLAAGSVSVITGDGATYGGAATYGQADDLATRVPPPAVATRAGPAAANVSAIAAAQGTPEVQIDPTATATAAATDNPYPAPSGEITETLGDIDSQTVLNLVVAFAIVALLAVFGGRLIVALLRRLTRRTEAELDDLLLEAVRPLIGWLIAAVGFQIATSQLDFLSDTASEILANIYFVLYLFVIVAATWRLGDVAVDGYISQREEELDENLVHQVVPLLKRVAHFFLAFIAVAVLATHFGINVLAISAALGLTGFALALAAQDTIANIISGLVIMVDGPFKLGDRIEITALDTWGDVVAIGIRSSRVLTRDNRLVIVPNSSIVDSAVINYSLPDSTYRLQSDIGIGNFMDIPKVQEQIRESVRKLDGVLPDKPVDVWFIEFGESSMTFRVRWWVESYGDKRRMTDAVNAVIQELALQEEISMPNPTYTLENRLSLSDEDVARIARALKGLE